MEEEVDLQAKELDKAADVANFEALTVYAGKVSREVEAVVETRELVAAWEETKVAVV